MTIVFFTYLDKVNISNNLSPNVLMHCGNREDSLKAWSLLIELLEKIFGIKVDDDFFIFEEKPVAKNNAINFSISHSKNGVVIALSLNKCGADIQYKISSEKAMKLYKKVLSKNEIKTFETNFDLDYFNYIWVKKEAYSKLVGCGLNHSIFDENASEMFVKKIDDYYIAVATNDKIELIEL